MALWFFIKAVGKRWWALMSCAIFTGLGIYIAYANKSSDWAVRASFAAAVVCLFIACYLAWLEEHNQKLMEIQKVENAERDFLRGKPVLVLHSTFSDLRQNDQAREAFRVQNCGERAARWVQVRSVQSQLKHYSLQFGQIPVLTPGPSQGIPCQVWPLKSGAGLWGFFHDSDPEAALVWFDVIIECRDTTEAIVETMVRIAFDIETKVLRICAVPYTQKPPIA